MLIKRPDIQIISREVTLATGELVRAFFAVITIEGQSEVRFLGIKPIEVAFAATESAETILLSAPACLTCNEVLQVVSRSVFSPFFSLDLFANQLARAPSLG